MLFGNTYKELFLSMLFQMSCECFCQETLYPLPVLSTVLRKCPFCGSQAGVILTCTFYSWCCLKLKGAGERIQCWVPVCCCAELRVRLLCCCFAAAFLCPVLFYLVLPVGSITLTLELTFSISLGFTSGLCSVSCPYHRMISIKMTLPSHEKKSPGPLETCEKDTQQEERPMA